MTDDQLALFDPPAREIPDWRPPCAACGAPALANVYGPGNPESRLPGTELAWHEVERIDP